MLAFTTRTSKPTAADPAARYRWRARGVVIGALTLAIVSLAGPGSAGAKVFLTVEEGLVLAFPDCTIEKKTVFLTEAQLEAIAERAGMEVDSAVVHPYEAICDGERTGVAYLDTHRVRTLAETLMVAIDSESRVRRIEILAFREPEEYIPRSIWYEQFTDRPLTPELRLKREIRGVTGATLTAHATTDAVRRVLAIHETLYGDVSETDAEAAE